MHQCRAPDRPARSVTGSRRVGSGPHQEPARIIAVPTGEPPPCVRLCGRRRRLRWLRLVNEPSAPSAWTPRRPSVPNGERAPDRFGGGAAARQREPGRCEDPARPAGPRRERDPQAARRAPRKTRASTACRIARAPPAIAALTRSASSEPAPSSDQFTRSQGRAWVVTAVAMATAHVHRSAPRRSGRPSSAPWSGRRPSGHLQSGG